MVIIGKVLSAAVKMEHRWIFDEVIKICDLVFADQVILQLFLLQPQSKNRSSSSRQ